MKFTKWMVITLILTLFLSGCSTEKEKENETITFDAVLEEINDGSWLVTTTDDVGFEKASVGIGEDVSITFNPMIGQILTLEIKPEIRESYPVQVTAVSVSLKPTAEEKPKYTKIDPEEAKRIMDSKDPYVLVDVRTEAEYQEGHIEGAILLPVDQIETLAEQTLPDLNATILVYCRSGNRSGTASRTLLDMGYTKVLDFGGIIDWPYGLVK